MYTDKKIECILQVTQLNKTELSTDISIKIVLPKP